MADERQMICTVEIFGPDPQMEYFNVMVAPGGGCDIRPSIDGPVLRVKVTFPRPKDEDTGLASCGHVADEDGECGCSSWPERAPLPT